MKNFSPWVVSDPGDEVEHIFSTEQDTLSTEDRQHIV